MVGEDEERPVAQHRLVAVVWARAGDQQHRWEGAFRPRLRQGPGEGDPCSAILVANRLLRVWEGRKGVLGPPLDGVGAFGGGLPPREHAVSRFHVRWYPVTMVFLAFDMEMLFMYPWTLVVSRVGAAAVIEMFLFLAILLAGVLYAWREGALRWT